MKSNGDDYNPLAMLGGQLRKDGDDDPRSVFSLMIRLCTFNFFQFKGVHHES